MKSINRTLRSLAALAVAATAFVSQAYAAPLVYVDPVSQNSAGPTATIGIYISGLTQAAGAVSFSLGFNGAILSGLGGSYTVDPTGGMGVALNPLFNDFSAGFSAGALNIDLLADISFATDAALFASEGSGATPFKLATVTFGVVGNGLSALTLSKVAVSDFSGLADLNATSRNGQICVPANCVVAVPEPASMWLVATALGALAVRRRKQTA